MATPDQDSRTPAPPGEVFAPENITISRKAAWAIILFFLLLLGLPPLIQDVIEWRKGPAGWLPARELARAVSGASAPEQTIEHRLRGFDAGVARLGFTQEPRQWSQQIVTSLLRRGNDRTFPGEKGWLFYRPELKALTGYGPLQPEPHSVSRDPALLDWTPPLKPLADFAASLKERGVQLWLVPVPMKPVIYPEKLTGHPATGPVAHPDTTAFYNQLQGMGIRVIDLAQELWALKASDATEGPVYLPDDTHWTPRGMAHAAKILAGLVQQEPWFASLPNSAFPVESETVPSRTGHGDLVEKLGARFPDQLYPPYSVKLERQLVPATRQPLPADRTSPVVLLGDSFVNIFDDPSLGFAPADPTLTGRTSAGLGQHLAARLGRALDLHAVNGDGATGVRRWLANRGETVVRTKKVVIWVLASRDLILSRTLAKTNQVHWHPTPIAPDPAGSPVITPSPGGGPIVVEARAVEKARQAAPATANYPNSLYTVRYEILRTVSGPAVSGSVEVVHWNFQNRQPSPTAQVAPGLTYRLELQPWANQEALQSLNLETIDGDDPTWFAPQATAVNAP